jgi:ArsR family transcriptional regulator
MALIMDSAALLDLLGNENRRRILRLLATRACYVTEISDALGVSPKAVIGHLRKLEDAGLVVSYTDDGRRKYFRIARDLRLEVTVSRYGFGTKSAYPRSTRYDESTYEHLTLELPEDEPDDVETLAATVGELRALERELSIAQRWAQGQLTETLDALTDRVDDLDDRLLAGVLRAITNGHRTPTAIAEQIGAPPAVVAEAGEVLLERGAIVEVEDGWRLPRNGHRSSA